MPTIEGIECYISTPSGQLPEYIADDTVHTGPATGNRNRTCYIQSREDEEFTINLRVPPEFPASHREMNRLVITLFLDGTQHTLSSGVAITQPLFSFSTVTSDHGNFAHKLHFAKLLLTDDDAFKSTAPACSAASLGEIRVHVGRYIGVGTRLAQSSRPSAGNAVGGTPVKDESTPVHEKALKGRDISHAAKLGPGMPVQHSTSLYRTVGSHLDSVGAPYICYRFLYRSERALKSLGLIPRTPSPARSNSPELVPIAASSAGHARLSRRQLLERIRELEARSPVARVKRERDENTPVKVEGQKTTKRKKETAFIDLTD